MADLLSTLDTVRARAFRGLARPLGLTRAGLVAERVIRAFWPFVSVAMVVTAFVLLDGLSAPVGRGWRLGVLALAGAAGLAALAFGVLRFRMPTPAEALDRLDRSLPDRPITALGDVQIIGAEDPASQAVWYAHVQRMAARVAKARAVRPDLDVSDRDRFGLRLMAATIFGVAVVFGTFGRLADVPAALGPQPAGALAGGPVWEGWAEPPRYTGLPVLYLPDLEAGPLSLAQGTRITLRMYGEVGALSLRETVSGAVVADPSLPAQEFEVTASGEIAIDGPGGRAWQIMLRADARPTIELTGELEWAPEGALHQGFRAADDYGVVAAQVRIALDLGAVDRRYGLAGAPGADMLDELVLPLPLPISGGRSDFEDTLSENLSKHPLARLPVTIRAEATDGLDQTGLSEVMRGVLPGRRFFDPLAKSVIEVRRDLLWSLDNAGRSAQVLRAVTHRPDDIVRATGPYLKLRTAIRRLEADLAAEAFDRTARDDLTDVLWDIAMEIEFGNLADAKARLERAEERLAEAIENGASESEIAALIEELRQAMQDYIRELAQQQGQDGQNQSAQNQQGQQMTGQDLQDLLDRLQELMEQGRMAEAQALLDQLRQMMENMQVTQGQQGQGQQSPGQQAMEGLAETLRDQQGLSDEAFRDLQDQFNPGQGQQGQQGQGQQPGQQPGQQQGQPGGPGQNGDPGQSLADRQQALRQELNRQRGSLPGAGTEQGDAAREALGRAGDAMDRAEENLRTDDMAGALDNQGRAIEALRDGMRALGEMMAQEQQQQDGQGQQVGQGNPQDRADPLGRDQGNNGRLGTEDDLLQGEDVYRRARELLDEIRRRQGDRTRPTEELDYLKRLLDRF